MVFRADLILRTAAVPAAFAKAAPSGEVRL